MIRPKFWLLLFKSMQWNFSRWWCLLFSNSDRSKNAIARLNWKFWTFEKQNRGNRILKSTRIQGSCLCVLVPVGVERFWVMAEDVFFFGLAGKSDLTPPPVLTGVGSLTHIGYIHCFFVEQPPKSILSRPRDREGQRWRLSLLASQFSAFVSLDQTKTRSSLSSARLGILAHDEGSRCTCLIFARWLWIFRNIRHSCYRWSALPLALGCWIPCSLYWWYPPRIHTCLLWNITALTPPVPHWFSSHLESPVTNPLVGMITSNLFHVVLLEAVQKFASQWRCPATLPNQVQNFLFSRTSTHLSWGSKWLCAVSVLRRRIVSVTRSVVAAALHSPLPCLVYVVKQCRSLEIAGKQG